MQCHKCNAKAEIKSGNYWYCPYHYRHLRIRIEAKVNGKTVPTPDELTALLKKHEDMICPNCKTKMNWLGRDGRKHVLTFQHNMDGSFGILCHSCNAAHQFIPKDGFFEKKAGTRFCQDCKAYLPVSEFFKDSRLKDRVKTYCKKCANKRTYKWRRAVKYKGKKDWRKY